MDGQTSLATTIYFSASKPGVKLNCEIKKVLLSLIHNIAISWEVMHS